MKNLNTYIRCVVLFCCLVAVTPFSKAHCSTSYNRVNSALQNDTTKSGKRVFKATEYGHNVLDMLQQGRFRYGDKKDYSNKGFFKHLYFGTSFGIDQLATRYDYQYNPAFMWGLSIGKEVNKTNALSLNFFYGKSESEITYSYFYRYAIQLNHYFNFSRYYLGYNPERSLEISSMIGAGYQFGEVYGRNESASYLSLGLKGDIRLGKRVNLAIEPYVNFGGEGYNGAEKGYWYTKYNVSYGARAAVNYTFSNELDGVLEEVPFSRNYMFVTTGLQSLNSNLDFKNTLGPTLAFGYGHWLSPRVAMQFTAGWGASAWKSVNTKDAEGNVVYAHYPKTQYLFGRAEAVFNVIEALKENRMKGFALDFMGGYEFGRLWKNNTSLDDQYTDSYGGVTAALRMKYYHSEGKAYYIEPRVTYATYGKPGVGYDSDIDYHRLDSRYSLALGMEYGNPAVDGKGRLTVDDEYEPQISVLALFGPNYMFNYGVYSGGTKINGSYGLGVEFQPFKYFGLRAMLDYSTYSFDGVQKYNAIVDGNEVMSNGVWNRKYNVISGIFDAKFDLTNIFYGYNSDRRWSNALYLGAVLSSKADVNVELKEGPKPENSGLNVEHLSESAVGGHVAFNTSYAMNDAKNWRLFGELDLRLYGDKFLTDNAIDNGPIRALAFRVGSSYSLDANKVFTTTKNFLVNNEDIPFSTNYFFMSTGLQSLSSHIDFKNTLAPSVTLGYGHWFSKHFGAQLSAGWSAGGWQRIDTYDADGNVLYTRYPKSQFFFGRAETMFNIFSAIKDTEMSGFSLDYLLGAEVGKSWKYNTSLENQLTNTYLGLTTALRLKYYHSEAKAIYLEPRVTLSSKEEALRNNGSNNSDTRYSLALGMEYGNPAKDGKGRLAIDDEFESKTSIFASFGPNYVFNRDAYSGGTNINGSYGIGLEYQPFKYFGLRAMFDYSTYSFNKVERYNAYVGGAQAMSDGIWNREFNIVSGVFDAKFDLTNMFYGYNSDRRWNNALYVGAVLSRYDNMNTTHKQGPKPVNGINLYSITPYKNFVGGHVAFNTSYSFAENWKLFGELDLRIYKNEFVVDKAVDYNPTRTLAFRLGSSYTLNSRDVFLADDVDLPFASDYFFMAGGLQSLYAKIQFKNTLGPALTMGYGHWFSKYLGYQLSAGWSAGAWRYMNGDHYPKSQHVFGRVEMMLGLLRALNETSGRGFSAVALGGVEFGRVWRYRNTLEDQTEAGYAGFTGGLRFKYHANEGKNLFIEPRLTYANFIDEQFAGTRNYHSLVTRFTLSAGVEFGSPYNCGAGSKAKVEDEFNPSLSVMAMAGPSYIFNRETYSRDLKMDYSMALGVEYQPYKIIGARAMLDVSNYCFTSPMYALNSLGQQKSVVADKNYTYLAAIVDAKLDLSNIFYGYDSERRWNTALYLGPTFTKRIASDATLHNSEDKAEFEGSKLYLMKADDVKVGFHTAFNAKYKMTNKLNVFGEVDLRLNENKIIYENSLDYNPVRMLGFRLGLSYDIK